MLELLKELCRLNGVSGAEDPVRNFIRTQAQPYADSLRSDALGNLIVLSVERSLPEISSFSPPTWMRWA